MPSGTSRTMPFGAEPTDQGVDFRVWAPRRQRVRVKRMADGRLIDLQVDEPGFFRAVSPDFHVGDRYAFRLDDEERDYPDPASRYQPDGVHGPSTVVDPRAFPWHDTGWPGIYLPGQVIYELHIGCFTESGTWRAAESKLQFLADMGITTLEIMPVAAFDGRFGWGYDGVKWYSPTELYGTPDEFRHFVDTAHAIGLGVILDVVYNHFGPSGNYTAAFSPYFISKRHPTEWGDALNYDGEGAQTVRDFVVHNAAYWIREFHLDGLRLDATQSIYDDSTKHLLADLSQAARAAAAPRSIVIVAENETQEVRHVQPLEHGGFGLDAVWNDDFHHVCRVAATGHAEYYYADYRGSAQELLSAVRHGYLFQGQYSRGLKRYRGTPTWGVDRQRFVTFLQNHDQVANSARGLRLPDLTSPGIYRALTTLWLLSPGTPMFFMGQEFGARTPFWYFADHEVALAQLVRDGRWEGLRQFPRIAGWQESGFSLPDPADEATFRASKLDWSASEDSPDLRLHRDLLALRQRDFMLSRQAGATTAEVALEGAVVTEHCFVVRWHWREATAPPGPPQDRLLVVNLGRDYHWECVAEPLVAPPPNHDWQILFSSDSAAYGGSGTALLDTTQWNIPGQAAVLLEPQKTNY